MTVAAHQELEISRSLSAHNKENFIKEEARKFFFHDKII